MRDLTPELDSSLTSYTALMWEMEEDLPSEETPLAVEPPGLFPVRLGLVKKFMKGSDEQTQAWVLTMVEVLNYYRWNQWKTQSWARPV